MSEAPSAVHITRAASAAGHACVIVSDATRTPLLLAWVRTNGEGAAVLDGDDVFVPLVDICHSGDDVAGLLEAHTTVVGGLAADPRSLLGPRPSATHLAALVDVLYDAESDLADAVDSLDVGTNWQVAAAALLARLGGAVVALDMYQDNIDDLYLRNSVLGSASAAVDAYGGAGDIWGTAASVYDTLVDAEDPYDRTVTVVAGMDTASCELFIPGAGGTDIRGDIDLFLGLTGFGLTTGGGIVVRRAGAQAGGTDAVCGYVLADGRAAGVPGDVLASQTGLQPAECVDAAVL